MQFVQALFLLIDVLTKQHYAKLFSKKQKSVLLKTCICLERWQSGRMRSPRKRLFRAKRNRGFESPSLLQHNAVYEKL